jgi:short-subunit dehydrogenase
MVFDFHDRCVVITGAANGIGKAMVHELVARRANVVAIDRDVQALEALQQELGGSGQQVLALVCDLTDGEAIACLPSIVEHAGLSPDCLINNAGMGSMGLFSELENSEIEAIFSVNFWGALNMIRAFLPGLMARPDACIVNIASILGIVAAPNQSPYVASKFALRGFSEALAMELSGSNVRVCIVYPGGVATSIVERSAVAAKVDKAHARTLLAQYSRTLTFPPQEAARIIVNGIETGKTRILIGRVAKFVDLIQRLMPSSYAKFLSRLTARQDRQLKRYAKNPG